jgi:RNA polymerase sigma-70 factor (ECF subfamily)
MLKVKDGDLDRLGLLFERYNRRLFKYFYRLTSQQQTSEDLVQAVFERILKYRHTYTQEGAFSTWIYQIARNLHSDWYRKHQKSRITDNPVQPERIKSDENEDFEFESESDRDLALLQQAIEKLDPVKRETLVLSRYQGLKYKEIAKIMDCSVSAVKVRIFRAINELKEIIDELKDEA